MFLRLVTDKTLDEHTRYKEETPKDRVTKIQVLYFTTLFKLTWRNLDYHFKIESGSYLKNISKLFTDDSYLSTVQDKIREPYSITCFVYF